MAKHWLISKALPIHIFQKVNTFSPKVPWQPDASAILEASCLEEGPSGKNMDEQPSKAVASSTPAQLTLTRDCAD